MIKLVKKYLHTLSYSSKIESFENYFNSHPSYLSLLAITDSLSAVEIKNIAAKIPFNHFSELPKTFIAELGNDDDKEFYFVEKKELEVFIINEKNYSKSISLEVLDNLWTGVVLLIKENEEIVKVQSSNNLKMPLVLFLLGILIIIVNDFDIKSSLYLMVSFLGLFISYKIIETYFEKDDVGHSKLCNVNKDFSCNSTIKSKKYVFSKYVEFVDLPVIFFAFTSLGLIFSIVSINTIGFLSSLSLPIVAYSIYIQKKVLQKWCILCLLISLILIANSILFSYFNLNFKILSHLEILLLILIVVLWFFLKNLLINKEENKKTVNQLLRFKRNEDVFNAISLDLIDIEDFFSLPKITIGNIDAPNTLTLFISPSCPHCHTAIKEALDVLEKYREKIKLEIAYNLNINNVDNPYLDIAKTIMQLFNQNKDYKLALIDWHINKLDVATWKKKWFPSDDFIKENKQLEKQFEWCLVNKYNYSPVKIFNGKLITQNYEIGELFYFFY